jgi:hypothetical protein
MPQGTSPIPVYPYFSFCCALEISSSMFTCPLTSRKTAAEVDTAYTAEPVGAGSEGERMVMEEKCLPESDLMDCSWEEAVSCVFASDVWT